MKIFMNLIALSLLIAGSAFAQGRAATEPKILGGWELSKFLITSPDGKTVPFCEGAFGKIIYEKSGYMSVAINCPSFTPSDPAQAYHGMLFYSGRFVNQGSSVIHSITNSTIPSLIGKTVTRPVEVLTDTTLVLGGGFGADGILHIEWTRIPVAE